MTSLPSAVSRHIKESFGARLKALRGAMSLEELERHSRISAEMLSAYERGKYQPSLDKLLRLQDALELPSVEYLFGEVDSPFMPSARLWGEASQKR